MLFKSAEIAVISDKSNFEGRLETLGTLTIFGSFTGRINSGTLEIGKDGITLGSAEAESVTIAGVITSYSIHYTKLYDVPKRSHSKTLRRISCLTQLP